MRDITPAGLVMIEINGRLQQVSAGTTVAAALLQANLPSRRSVTGEPRTALCGMGVCFECRAGIDGVPHRRTCLVTCRDGMVVETHT
jgi:sarcosine oxidase subunit alpha